MDSPELPLSRNNLPRNCREKYQLRLGAVKESRFPGCGGGLREGVHSLCELGVPTLDGHFRFEYLAPQGFFDVLL